MAAILKNGGHIKILRGPRFFLVLLPPKSICAKSVACIIIWTILTVICSTTGGNIMQSRRAREVVPENVAKLIIF